MDRKLTCILVAILVLSACSRTEGPTETVLRPVRYLTVTDDTVFRDRSFSGTSKSSRESRLSFKVTGTVINVPVQIGQRLAAGDLIAELDPASYVLKAQQAQATLIEAQANDRRASANYERTKGLYADNNASLNDLDAARAQAESAAAAVAAADKSLEIARLNVSDTRLRADGDCSIAGLNIEVNENVSPGQQVASVSCGDTFEVTLDLPESLIGSLDESTPVSIRFSSIPNQVFDGDVTEIAVASTAGAAFPVVIRIDGSHPALRSGLAADVTFQFDSAAVAGDGVVIPVAALINGLDGTYVYTAQPNGTDGEATVERRPVVVGELSEFGVEIVSGLKLGDRVIIAGVSVIRDGQRVLIAEEQQEAA